MRSTYEIKCKVTVTVAKGAPGAVPLTETFTTEGQIERVETDELSPEQHVRVRAFDALAPAKPGDQTAYAPIVDAVTRAAVDIAAAVKAGESKAKG